MRHKYGGVARKQPIPEINGIYNEQIEYMLSLIYQSIENEIETVDYEQVIQQIRKNQDNTLTVSDSLYITNF